MEKAYLLFKLYWFATDLFDDHVANALMGPDGENLAKKQN